MKFFYWLIFLAAIGIAIFAVQNSNAPLVMMKFIIWRLETSLVYIILGSIGVGILLTLFFWVPKAIKSSIRTKELKKEMQHLEMVIHRSISMEQERNIPKEP